MLTHCEIGQVKKLEGGHSNGRTEHTTNRKLNCVNEVEPSQAEDDVERSLDLERELQWYDDVHTSSYLPNILQLCQRNYEELLCFLSGFGFNING